jgi:hypothetical protein
MSNALIQARGNRAISFQPNGFAPDRLAYDMVRMMFLPWTFMQGAFESLAPPPRDRT